MNSPKHSQKPYHLGFQFSEELLTLEILNKRPKESYLLAAMVIVSKIAIKEKSKICHQAYDQVP